MNPYKNVPITSRESGIALVSVLVFLLVIAAAVALRGGEEIADIKLAAADAEARRVDYVAQAGLQHALWTAQANTCAGATTIPVTSLDGDTYSATITGGGGTTAYTLLADQDSWIRSDNPTDNKGSDSNLHIRFESGVIEQPLYRFDLSALPAGAQINSAEAWFHAKKAHPEGPVTVHKITRDWTEAGVTWDNLGGSYGAQPLGTIPAVTADGEWVSINMTGQVQAWVNGQPNYGVLLNTVAEGVHAEYEALDNSNPPRLEVVVGAGSPSPLNIQATGTLANGKSLQLSRPTASAYQPPNFFAVQPGPTDGIDTYIWEGQPTTPKGSDDEVWASNSNNNTSRALFRFNTAAIPAGAEILNATLSLQHESGNNPNVPITAHRISNPWDQAAATWFKRNSTTNWDTAGGDFDATVFDTVAVGWANDRYEWDITALAQGWVDGAYPNYGVALATAQWGSIGERFFSSDETFSDRRPSLTITYACECGSACMAPQGSGNVLFVVGSVTSMDPGDLIIQEMLEAWGYTVNLIAEEAGQGGFDAEFGDNDVVLISESVNEGMLANKVSFAPIGVVNAQDRLNDELGIATDEGDPVTDTLDVIDNDHYITRIFPAAALQFKTAATELGAVAGTLAPDARVLANAGGAGAVVALDAGGMGSGGNPVPARRALVPVGEASVSWSYLTNNGQLLVQRTLAWAMGADDTSIGGVLFVTDDASDPPTSLSAQDNAKIALMESWGFTVMLISDHDSQAAFDTALAGTDVAYVSVDVRQNDLGTKLVATSVGVVNEDPDMYDEFGIAERSWSESNHSDLDIVNNTHYVTTPFPLGTLTLTSSNQSFTVIDISFPMAPDLQLLGRITSGGSRPALSALEAGGQTWDGGTAAGRRAQVPWANSFDISSLTPDGEQIMRRALEWGAGAVGAAPVTIILSSHDSGQLGGLSFTQADLVEYDPATDTATLYFDGAALFTDPLEKVQSAHVLPNGHIILSTRENATLGGLSFTQADLVEYDPGSDTATLFFDGATLFSDPLTRIASAQVLGSGEIILSTWAGATLGGLTFTSAQLVVYDPSTDTAQLYFDGATLFDDPLETIDAVHVLSNKNIVLSTWDAATLGGLSLETGDLVEYDLTTDTATLYFDGAARFTDPLQKLVSAHITGDPGPPDAVPGGASYTVLLVSGNAASPPAKDTGMETLMTGWGFTVDWIDDGDTQANFDTKMAAADVVYVSGTVSGPSLLDKVTGVNKGVVNEINGKLDNFGFSSSTSLTALSDRFSKTDPAHFITESFGGEWATVFTSGLAMPIPSGTLAPDLQTAGQVSGLPGMVTLAAGATRWDGNPAPARRVHLPFTNADSSQLTADGETIMERAIRWAAGEGGDTGSGGGGGPTGVTFEAFTEASNGSTTSLDIAKPGGTGTGDLLIATLATDGSTAGSIAPPAGWAVVDLTVQSGAVTYGVWWKLAGAGEPANYTFSWSGGEAAYGTVMRFTGHDPTDPIDVFANAGGSSSAPASPAVTTTVADAMILRLGGFDDDDIDQDVTGLTDHTTITMDDTGNGPNTTSSGAGYVLQPAAGSSGTANFALTGTEEYRSVTLAIAPAP